MNAASLDRWTRVWRQVTTSDDPEPVFRELVSSYSESQRHYHNLQHIADCLFEFDSARGLANQPVALELAIWFHDAVYDPHAADNEERSAELAKQRIRQAGGRADLCDTVATLILATKTHEPALHCDAALLIDVDLSILGQHKERFEEYEAQVRREYEWVPSALFKVKRGEILEKFLARHRIYVTGHFFAKYEQQARNNLQNSISSLMGA